MIVDDTRDNELHITEIETMELKKWLREEVLNTYNVYMGFK